MATGVEPRALLLNLDCIRVTFANDVAVPPHYPTREHGG